MTLYLIFIILLIILSYFGFSINIILMTIAFTYAYLIDFTLETFIFVAYEKFNEIVFMPEIIAIPFLIFGSELLINSGITREFKNAVYKIFGSNFLSFIIYSIFIMTTSTTSMVFNNAFEKDFDKDDFKDEKYYIKTQFIISSINYIAPISVPLIIMSSLLKISLKNLILYTITISIIMLIIYYIIFLRNKLSIQIKNAKMLPIIVISLYLIIFYIMMFMFSCPIDIIAIILFFYVAVVTSLSDNKKLIETTFNSFKNASLRSGIIIGVVYFITLVSFFHIYTQSNNEIVNYITLSFSEVFYILIIIYIIAFIMSDLIDPLGIILIMFPIYNILLQSNNINKYIFIISFSLFISSGLFNDISELMGNRIINRFNISKVKLYEILFPTYIFICIISLGLYFI